MRSKKNVTLHDIAQALKISVSSVSLAIGNQPGISDELRAQVIAKAQELGYRKSKRTNQNEDLLSPSFEPQNSKLSGESTTTFTNAALAGAQDAAAATPLPPSTLTAGTGRGDIRIDVLIDNIFTQELSSFYMEIFRQISQYSLANNISVFIQVLDHHDQARNEQILKNLHYLQPQGVIVIGQIKPQDLSLLKSNVLCPVVFIDYYLESEKHYHFVLIDSFSGMHRLVKNLIEEYHYHDMCFVGSIHKTTSILDRYLGYVKALKEHGLEDSISRILPDRDLGDNEQIHVVLPEDKAFHMPEIFVCNCDKTALALIKALQKRGLKVPEDVGVCGFDNFIDHSDEPFANSYGLKIHTFDHSPQQLAYVALESLMHRITTNYAPHLIYIEGKIVQGNSISQQAPASKGS
ncbi:MAG TPA: LacI family DNA-binding transcriptional regulator [Candidatus Anaerobiospirillum pullistercoris]|uniref:LacI family DNA-binding transcriptional regulator n=1 Tax=Candidatus Anaerobiospirillum pullistercoris TaxID=2838452 RepID=A0A9D2B067_9GAMM|nr:LacI family DNA-binding transcriptional regulator [Candidatus Anaerobiospirillum pullistercoris]